MSKTRIKFNKELLEKCMLDYNAILLGTYQKITRNIDINYICSCGQSVLQKNFRQVYITGAMCDNCIYTQKQEKRILTCLLVHGETHASKNTIVKEKGKQTFKKNLLENKDSIVITHPEIASQWHPTKNENNPSEFTEGSNQYIWWKCDNVHACGCPHEWYSTIYSRIGRGSSCPYCSKNKICIHNSILYTHPDIASQWHPTLNIDLKPEHFSSSSDKEVWWLCPQTCIEGCKHEYLSTIGNRINGDNKCPYCCKYKKKHCIHTSIITTHPELMKEWHPTKNTLNPQIIGHGSHESVWWICPDKHEWKAIIYSRTTGNGCPDCRYKGEKKLSEYLKLKHPIKNQVKYDWCKNIETNRHLPFDFEIYDKIIIELDGDQHFIQVSNWKAPEIQKKSDEYKMKMAFENNKHIIRINHKYVLKDKNNWILLLETSILRLLKISEPTLILIGIPNNYILPQYISVLNIEI